MAMLRKPRNAKEAEMLRKRNDISVKETIQVDRVAHFTFKGHPNQSIKHDLFPLKCEETGNEYVFVQNSPMAIYDVTDIAFCLTQEVLEPSIKEANLSKNGYNNVHDIIEEGVALIARNPKYKALLKAVVKDSNTKNSKTKDE